MSDNPQPTPGRDTTVRKAILAKIRISQYTNGEDGYSSETLLKLANLNTDAIMQILIAEQTRLLERLKEQAIGKAVGVPCVPVSAIDAELQQLRAGHEPDGGEG